MFKCSIRSSGNMSRRTNQSQRKVRIPSGLSKKKKKAKVEKIGEIPCGVSGCDGWSDKHMNGRSLSQENAIEMWGEGSFTVRKNRVRVCKSCYRSWKKENKDESSKHY